MSSLPLPRERAESLVRRYTGIATATGAAPVPGASWAVIAENTAMVNNVASAMGVPVSVGTIVSSFGLVGTVNFFGKNLFIEGARLLGWGAGPLGIAPVMALGASTAGAQTWILGQLTIAICENGGNPLPSKKARVVMDDAAAAYEEVTEETPDPVY